MGHTDETLDAQTIHDESLIAHNVRRTARGFTVTATAYLVVEIDGQEYAAEREIKIAVRPKAKP